MMSAAFSRTAAPSQNTVAYIPSIVQQGCIIEVRRLGGPLQSLREADVQFLQRVVISPNQTLVLNNHSFDPPARFHVKIHPTPASLLSVSYRPPTPPLPTSNRSLLERQRRTRETTPPTQDENASP